MDINFYGRMKTLHCGWVWHGRSLPPGLKTFLGETLHWLPEDKKKSVVSVKCKKHFTSKASQQGKILTIRSSRPLSKLPKRSKLFGRLDIYRLNKAAIYISYMYVQ